MKKREINNRERIRIIGPTARDSFFIATADNLIWDGERWRGFGAPREFKNFRSAWIAADNAEAALRD